MFKQYRKELFSIKTQLQGVDIVSPDEYRKELFSIKTQHG